MWLSSATLLSFIASSTIVQGISLSDALKQQGASEFATFIASDPVISALYNSSKVKTIFAPIDGSQVTKKVKRASPPSLRNAEFQSANQTHTLASLSVGNGAIIQTNENDNSTNLNGQPQNAVSNPTNSTQSSVAKRQFTFTTILPAPPAETVTITYSPSTPDCTTTTILPPPLTVTVFSSEPSPSSVATGPSLLKIYAGLGNFVNIIKADIPYDGGLIQLVDNYFTLPELVSNTAIAENHTTFAQLGASAGLTTNIDTTPEITCFIPTNAAFDKPNSTSSYSTTSSLLSGHIIPNFLGYLPSLKNGASFTTQGGTNITVTIDASNNFFINNAKIIDSNLIVDNGVCHVIDSVITPSTALPTPFTGDASPLPKRSIMDLAMWGFAICLGAALLV